MDKIQLQLSAESFFQLNIDQAEKMYQMAISKIDPMQGIGRSVLWYRYNGINGQG